LNLKCLHIKTQRKYFSSLIKAGLVGGVQTLQNIVVLKVISWFALLKYGRYMASLDFVSRWIHMYITSFTKFVLWLINLSVTHLS
jgi:hypothetical protein